MRYMGDLARSIYYKMLRKGKLSRGQRVFSAKWALIERGISTELPELPDELQNKTNISINGRGKAPP